AYTFVNIEINDPIDFVIQVSSNSYQTQSQPIDAALPGRVYSLDFQLVEEGDDDDDGSGGGVVVEGDPGVPAAIVLNEVSEEEINIRQTGGIVSSTFSFSVQDSSGRNMDQDSPVTVNFQILNGPDGGEAVVPASAETNSNGIVATSLFSGDSAGVVRVEAFFIREDGARISSSPILIAISGGFPHPDHFFVASENRNLEGFGFISEELEYKLVASVGDKFGNPVKIGTSVDFRSLDAGIINGSAITNENGFASVSFYPNGARPENNANGIGFFNVRAHTFDENNDDLDADVLLLFTTRTALITFDSGTFSVPANGSDNVSFTVTDLNGYPMAAGTTIAVTAEGTIGVAGDSEVLLGDYFVGGNGVTNFTVTLSDLDEENSNVVPSSVTVTVTTPSGYQTSSTLAGTRAKIK
ncbi:MAG: Ig-like domain-containing protein, partial [Balneolales bacterium]|nr:Ig-like domain-containing protein [Balneolales bacterium]